MTLNIVGASSEKAPFVAGGGAGLFATALSREGLVDGVIVAGGAKTAGFGVERCGTTCRRVSLCPRMTSLHCTFSFISKME